MTILKDVIGTIVFVGIIIVLGLWALNYHRPEPIVETTIDSIKVEQKFTPTTIIKKTKKDTIAIADTLLTTPYSNIKIVGEYKYSTKQLSFAVDGYQDVTVNNVVKVNDKWLYKTISFDIGKQKNNNVYGIGVGAEVYKFGIQPYLRTNLETINEYGLRMSYRW